MRMTRQSDGVRLGRRFASPAAVSAVSATMSIPMILLAYIGTARWPAVAPMQVVIGAGFGVYMTLSDTLTQRQSPLESAGRVVAARRGVEESFGLVGALAAGAAPAE